MRKIIFTLLILFCLFFLFNPVVIPSNFDVWEIFKKTSNNDVIIIFNSGGWGDTPLEEAKDFSSIIEGIQGTLKEWGYNSIVIPYNRTENTFLGKISGAKEFLSSFNLSSKILAEDLEVLAENLPDKKIILAGLSSGATFVSETYEGVSKDLQNSVYAIAVGAPFWAEVPESSNLLRLNEEKDTLVKGDVKALFSCLFKAPFRWFFSKFSGQNLTFTQVLHATGHDYDWSSPEVSSQIVTFLEEKFRY